MSTAEQQRRDVDRLGWGAEGGGTCNVTKDFILAGCAIFTVRATPSTGVFAEWYTYKVRKADNCDDGKIRYFVGLLTKPDNFSGYSYIGMLNPEFGTIKITGGSKIGPGARSVRILMGALRVIWGDQAMPQSAKIMHAGRCGHCGRLLTTPESVERGIGPECAALMQGAATVAATTTP